MSFPGAIVGVSANLEIALAAPPIGSETKIVVDEYNLTAAGTSVNVARALKVNGVDAKVIALAGCDPAGELLKVMIDAQGLDVLMCAVRAKTPITAIAENLHGVSEPVKICAKPRMSANESDLDGARREISNLLNTDDRRNLLRVATGVKPEEVIFVEELLFGQNFPDQFLVLNPSMVFIRHHRKKFEELAGRVDLLSVNHEEAEVILGRSDFKAQDIHLLKNIAPNVLVTWSSNGSLLWWGGKLYTAHAPKVDVVDPTGAGDCYLGYFLAEAVVGRKPIEEAMQTASIASALEVRHWGANQTPMPAQVEWFRAEYM